MNQIAKYGVWVKSRHGDDPGHWMGDWETRLPWRGDKAKAENLAQVRREVWGAHSEYTVLEVTEDV